MTARITISMPDALEARINSQLEYGDNRSELIRELIRRGLDDMEGDDSDTGGERDPTPAPEPTAEDVALGPDLPSDIAPADARDAVRAALAQLDESGGASKGEIVRAVMPEHPLGYDVDAALTKLETEGERYRGSWWRRVIKPGLQANGAQYDQRVGWTR